MDGLGICCFNRQRQIWEIGFLRHHQHNHVLAVGIQGALSTSIALDPANRDAVIRIETINGISQYKEFPDGFFGGGPVQDRTKDPAQMSDDEKENFRWAIDLEDPQDEMKQGQGHLVKPPAGIGVTRAFIADAVFYTRSIGTQDLFNLKISENGSTMSDSELEAHKFGKTNNVTAADITCAGDGAVNVIIDDGHGHDVTVTLPHRPGNPWQITLRNMRPDGISFGGHHDHEGRHGDLTKGPPRPEMGDYQLYYAAFDLADHRKQRALWGFPETNPAASGRTDCNLVWDSNTDDLDGLF